MFLQIPLIIRCPGPVYALLFRLDQDCCSATWAFKSWKLHFVDLIYSKRGVVFFWTLCQLSSKDYWFTAKIGFPGTNIKQSMVESGEPSSTFAANPRSFWSDNDIKQIFAVVATVCSCLCFRHSAWSRVTVVPASRHSAWSRVTVVPASRHSAWSRVTVVPASRRSAWSRVAVVPPSWHSALLRLPGGCFRATFAPLDLEILQYYSPDLPGPLNIVFENVNP